MKKIITVILILTSLHSSSQTNTFPTTGNAGVGTTSPGFSFEVISGNASWASKFSHSTSGSAVYMAHVNGFGMAIEAGTLASSSTYALQVAKGTSYFFYVRGDGRTGIGTAAPAFKLDVNGNAGVGSDLTVGNQGGGDITLITGGSGYGSVIQNRYADGSVNNHLSGSGNNYFNNVTGNLGIGTAAPAFKLDVNGNAGVGSDLTVGNQGGGDVTLITGGSGYGSVIQNRYADGSVNNRLSGNGNNYFNNVTGNLGIGTASPAYRLDVNGTMRVGAINIDSHQVGDEGHNHKTTFQGELSGTNDDVLFDMSKAGGAYGSFQYRAEDTIRLYLAGNRLSADYGHSYVMPPGNFGIGTSSPSEKLSVEGNIKAKKLIITQTGWSDYVFDKQYKLRTLSALERFIKENKHLPGVPSAKEVEEKGISVGDNQALLLKKIEELTLYVIELNKKNEALTQKVLLMENKNK